MDNFSEIASQLFKASGHNTRVKILKNLEKSDKTAKDLSKIVDTSETCVHQHLNKLNEGGLIKKNGRYFSLSTSGRIFVSSFGIAEVVGNYRNYWESHSVDKIPPGFLKDIGVLRNTNMIISAPKVIDRFMDALLNHKKRLLIVIDRVAKVGDNEINEMINKRRMSVAGMETFILIGIIPSFLSQNRILNRYLPGLEIKTTSTKNIYMGLCVVDDKEAGVIFPDYNGLLDWNFAIYGLDPDFISWVENNFWEMYEKGESI